VSGESYAGIEVPEGEPGALNDAAGQFGAIASSLSGVASDLRGLPAAMTWSGPASVSYAGACLTNSGAVDTAVDAFGQAEHAARAYAGKLKDAKQRAREAIRDARDAQQRIDQAQRDSGAAQDRRIAAANAEAFAAKQVSIALATATPARAAEADQLQAPADGAAAADDEARARRELARAQDDLERAKKRGREAMEDARDAARAAASAFGGASASSPAYAAAGAPAAGHPGAGGGSWWNTTNEGSKFFDEDAFLAQLVFFHPKNDAVGRYKWWGDRALDAGAGYGKDALLAYGFKVRSGAISTMDEWALSASRTFVAGPSGIAVVNRLTATRTPVTVIDADTWVKGSKLMKGSRAIPFVGGAIAIGSAGWDQYREDASNPNLTQTDRVGRAAGVGVYVGGASIAGAAIGTAIFPGVGTGVGLVIGAGAGLAAGAVAASITPAKEFMADVGSTVANGAVDGYHTVVDTAGDVKDKLSDGLDSVKDHIPDLNPF
jgi:hypothetical protein